jgi:hypothetical protein
VRTLVQNPDHCRQRLPAQKDWQRDLVVGIYKVIGVCILVKDGKESSLKTNFPANCAVHPVEDKTLPKADMAHVLYIIPINVAPVGAEIMGQRGSSM